MNITQLNNILSNPKLKDDLLQLMARKIEIEQHLASYDDDLADIDTNVKALGLKLTEFNKIVKCVVNSEATLNELAALEIITDNLMAD